MKVLKVLRGLLLKKSPKQGLGQSPKVLGLGQSPKVLGLGQSPKVLGLPASPDFSTPVFNSLWKKCKSKAAGEEKSAKRCA